MDAEKHTLIAALYAIENLTLQNLALQSILARVKTPDWKSESDGLLLDPKFHPEVRKQFQQAREMIEQEAEKLTAQRIQEMLRRIPTPEKPN